MAERYPSLRFNPGSLYITPGACDALQVAGEEPLSLLSRHLTGDWGLVPAEDAQANVEAVAQGYRVMSVYETSAGTRLWVITEADRSATTFLLPDEY